MMKNSITPEKLLIYITLLLCSSVFTRVLNIPHFFNRIELFELIFLALFIRLFYKVSLSQIKEYLSPASPLDWTLVVSLGVFTMNVVINISRSALFDLLSLYYLFIVYLVLSRLHYFKIQFTDLIPAFKNALWCNAILCTIGIICLLFFNIENFMLDKYVNYPYLGTVYRLRGISYSNNILVSLVFIYLLFMIVQTKFSNWDRLLIFLSFVIIIFTFAKEQIYAYLCIFLFLVLSKNWMQVPKNIIKFLLPLFFIFCVFLTHFTICQENCFMQTWSVGPAMYELGDGLYLRPTGYYYLLVAEFYCFKLYPFFGVGLGNFEHFLMYKKLGVGSVYPDFIPNMPPHSIYSGLMAEMGLSSFIFFIGFIIAIIKTYTVFKTEKKQIYYALSICIFIFLVFQGIGCSGFLYARHHIIGLAMVSLMYNEVMYAKKVKIQI